MRGTPASRSPDVVAGPGNHRRLRRSQAFTRTVIERAPMLQARLPRRLGIVNIRELNQSGVTEVTAPSV